MTNVTLRRIKTHFVVTGADIVPMRFESRPEARDWCRRYHPGSLVVEIGRDASRRLVMGSPGRPRKVKITLA